MTETPITSGTTAIPSRSPTTRWVLSGPFSRIHDRDELLDDLEYAVKRHTTPTVLVLIGFRGLRERLDALNERDGNVILGQLAEQLATAVDTAAVLYEPRRGEFAALFDGKPKAVVPAIERLKTELDIRSNAFELQTEVGYVELPTVGLDPAATLARADRRLQEQAGDLRPDGGAHVRCLISAREAKKLARRSHTVRAVLTG